MLTWFLTFLITVFVVLIATRVVMACNISDSPDEARKLHEKVTPTSGGVGIAIGVFTGIGFAVWQGLLLLSPSVIACLCISIVGGILGLLDDIYILGAKRKLAIMLIAVTCFVIYGARIETFIVTPSLVLHLGLFAGAFGTIFWLLVLANTVNFMDGANGMAMGCSAIGLLGLSGLIALQPNSGREFADIAILGWIGFAACLGFLYWNAGLGRVFAGDTGALFIGLYCGTLGVFAVVSGVYALCVAACFLPMLVDVILTVVVRLKRKENVLTAHALHAYQRTIRHGASHLATSSRYWLCTLVCAFGAIVAQSLGGLAPLIMFVILLILLCAIYVKMVWNVRAISYAENVH